MPPVDGVVFPQRYRIDAGSITGGNLYVTGGTPKRQSGTSFTLFKNIDRFFYSDAILSTDQQDLFLNGAFPSNPCVVQYAINEEGVSKAYDLSGNNYDGVYGLDASAPVTVVNRTFTDAPGDPVVPASSIRVLVPAGVASPVTLSLSRPRQGVPSRATDGEKYETASGTITLVDPVTRIKVGPRQIYGVYL
jgi:hypothetical protein